MISSWARRAGRKPAVHARVAAVAICIAFAGAVADAGPAMAKKYASLVLDANSGKVLYARSADEIRYPASLTKMMTLYMAFEQISQRRLSYSSLVPISAQAAAQPPSKFGLKPGDKIKLIDAMKALVTKSANDIAVAIAEHIGGSEARFARMMTERARQIGMRNTVFRNASGLPNSKQKTTARDMIKLALALQDHFPGHYRIFRTRSMTYKGKKYKNHNALLGRYRGTDGIKTGYIRASGFNLVSSVRRDGKHLVAAVFGARTAKVRNAHMRKLLEKNFAKASVRKTRKPTPRLLVKPKPAAARVAARRPATMPRNTAQNGSGAAAKVHKVGTQGLTSQTTAKTKAATRQPASVARAPSTLNQQAAALHGAAAPAQSAPPGPAAATGGYQIQVGAYLKRSEAQHRIDTLATGTRDLLAGYSGLTQEVKVGNKQFYRARFAGFSSAKAMQTCNELRRRSIDCMVTRSR